MKEPTWFWTRKLTSIKCTSFINLKRV